jgi:hypothetical protein
MLYHVLMPSSEGGHVSLDYREDLTEALDALRHWKSRDDEDMAIAKGKNGEPLRYVVYYAVPATGKRVATGVYATSRGADRATSNLGWRLEPGVKEWGWSLVTLW